MLPLGRTETRRRTALFAGLAAFSLLGYLAASRLVYRVGFPLDDAWIHQTYARNLALRGEWSFLPGQPSAGSTAPLWSFLLAGGHALGLGPYVWTFLLGGALLAACAWTGALAFARLQPDRAAWAPWVGAGLALEWHLVWAAGSGMETLLAGVMALLALALLVRGQVNWPALGVLIGVSAWVRPDGVTLLGPAAVALAVQDGPWKERARAAGGFLIGLGLTGLPYLAFNRLLAGAWWPNTFFAKQAEYAILRDLPLWQRYAGELLLPLVGVGAALLPGWVVFTVQAIRDRRWVPLAGLVWALGYLFLYAWRLPVTYQHGRYVMPAMPVLFVWGAAGMAGWVRPAAAETWKRVLGRAWVVSAVVLLLAFWGLGAQAYGRDVAVIETEMVAAARWTEAHTEPDALVAAHDIGALGYFGGRSLLDLAGLISPEVIPFLRDEARLAAFLDERGANYLMTFPGWYPELTGSLPPVYESRSGFSPAAGGDNMIIYRWP